MTGVRVPGEAWPSPRLYPDLCDYDSIDPGIVGPLRVLRQSGIETFESCEGGPGHAYAEPSIRFHGNRSEGWKALAAARDVNLPVTALRRVWTVHDGEPDGPVWEIVFRRGAA
jgi:hypothetical protein